MIKRRDFLKKGAIALLGCSAANAGVIVKNKTLDFRLGGKRPVNVIYVLADDLAWAELGCSGNTFNETPNLDKMAGRGMIFTDAYAAAPVCSPYRAALMTGQYPARVGITDYLKPWASNHLTTDHFTVAEMFKKAGHITGMIGKWHLTGYISGGAPVEVGPDQHGFDEVIITENRGIGGGDYFYPYAFNTAVESRMPDEYLIDRCNLEAVEFIERHKNRPFFLYLSHYAVHTVMVGKSELVSKYQSKPGTGDHHLAAQLESIDEGVGNIMNKLDELGLTENTLLIFTSDNGGEHTVTSNAPFRASKSHLYEGGIREPLIAYCPGFIKSGAVCNTPVTNVDFYPTFQELIGCKPDAGQVFDGVSLLPLLKNHNAELGRDTIYWHYPHNHNLGGLASGAIRQGDWKLIEFFGSGTKELYNLAEDISEQNNLASQMPAKVSELLSKLAQWRSDIDV